MDVATLVGTLAGFIVIATAIFLGGGAGAFVNVPAVLITFGGTCAATLVHFPLAQVLKIFKIVKRTLAIDLPRPENTIERMVSYSRIARRDGALALEDELEDVDDGFLTKGLQLVIDGSEAEQVREVMLIELNSLQRRHKLGVNILSFMGEASPAFGMIGTLIGLVQMLRQLEDPSQIGTGMATALLTTFYGSLLANLLFIPLAGKLRTRSKQEVIVREMMIEGFVGIQNELNPRDLEDRMASYLHPQKREPQRDSSE